MHLIIQPPTSQGFMRQRIVKNGQYTTPGGSSVDVVKGWASDVTWPAIVDSDMMAVTGSGAATVTAQVNADSVIGDMWVTFHLYVGEAVRDSLERKDVAGTFTLTWTGTISDGDTVSLRSSTTYSGDKYKVFQANTWIDITPT